MWAHSYIYICPHLSCAHLLLNAPSVLTCSHPPAPTCLTCRNASRVGDKKVYLIMDAASQYSDDGLDRICAGLKREQIDLIIV